MSALSKKMFEKASELMPGGVSSPARAFKGVGGDPLIFQKGEGAYIFDVDGKKYVDYVLSWGPLILGHAHPTVIESVLSVARNGTSFGATCPVEIELAQEIVNTFDSIDQVRFVSSGTEATMSALRLARGYTGRSKIVKFEGGFHGHSDMLLSKAGSGVTTLDIPDSAGVPKESTQNTLTVAYNDADELAKLFAQHKGEIAAVIIEPMAGNMGFIKPKSGFLSRLRSLCDEDGAVLIFDEVMTGFRAGFPGAQSICKVIPDLTCLGKVIGGGLPVGAYGGRKEIMEKVAPLGPVYQAGTLSGNPLGMAAGLATLKTLKASNAFESISKATNLLLAGINACARAHGVDIQTDCSGTMFGIYFLKEADATIFDFASAKKFVDTQKYSKFFHAMAAKGFYFAPSAFEAGFLSAYHSDEVIDATISAVDEVFATWQD